MILTCPACETQFRVGNNAIPQGGRDVRCASCKHQWHAYSEDQAGELTPPPPPEPEIEDTPPKLSAVEEPSLVAFEESLGKKDIEEPYDEIDEVAEAIEEAVENSLPHDVDEEGYSLDEEEIHFATQVDDDGVRHVSVKPLLIAAGVLFALIIGTIGFLVSPATFGAKPSKGLVLADIEMRERKGRDNVRYIVEGKIVNETDTEQPVPKIRVAVMSVENEAILSREYIAAEGASINAGESMPFRADNLQTTQGGRVDHLLVDLGNGVEMMKRPLKWIEMTK